jgi:hypothetical protein
MCGRDSGAAGAAGLVALLVLLLLFWMLACGSIHFSGPEHQAL